jgi:hypothetical protein
VLCQYIICLVVTAAFLFNQKSFSLSEKAIVATLISWWVVNCGVLFERKKWVWVAEYIRIIVFGVGAAYLLWYFSPALYYLIGIAYLVGSLIWITAIRKHAWK